MPFGLDSTKTAERPAHEAIESDGGDAPLAGKTPQERLDMEAMESAKRAQKRIHEDEGKVPGTQIFTK
jgi:hypothetical protein